MNIYQSSTYRKDLSWLCFDNEPRVHKRQQAKDQQPYMPVFVACLTQVAVGRTSWDMAVVFHAWLCGRFTKLNGNLRKKKLFTTNQESDFIGGSLSNRSNVRTWTQFRRERSIKDAFFFSSTRAIRFVKWMKFSFPALKLTTHFLPSLQCFTGQIKVQK